MDIKLIAIGNRLMGDDAVAVCAAEILHNKLWEQGIEVIIGETDVEYCLDRIKEDDKLIILDAARLGLLPGSVWQMSLSDALDTCNLSSYQHERSLISALNISELNLIGLLICIEAADISVRFGLSEILQTQLSKICIDIYKIIMEYRSELENA